MKYWKIITVILIITIVTSFYFYESYDYQYNNEGTLVSMTTHNVFGKIKSKTQYNKDGIVIEKSIYLSNGDVIVKDFFECLDEFIVKNNDKHKLGDTKKMIDNIVGQLKGKFEENSDDLIKSLDKRILNIKEENCEKFSNFLIKKRYIVKREGKIKKDIEFEDIKEYYESNTELMNTIDTINNKFKREVTDKFDNVFRFLLKDSESSYTTNLVDSDIIDSIVDDFVEKEGLLTKISIESLLKDKFDGKEYKDKFNKFLEGCIKLRDETELEIYEEPKVEDSSQYLKIDPNTEMEKVN